MLGLGLSLPQAAIAATRFDPCALFAGGVAGGIYDPATLASMAATSDGVTPAAIDAPVGLIRDLSPSGTDLMQATATVRPMLRADADGRCYLDFDGGADFLAAAPASFAFTDAFIMAAALRFEGGAAFAAFAGTYATNSGWDIGVQSGNPRVTARGSAAIDTGALGFPDMTGTDAIMCAEVSRDAITRSVNGARLTTAGSWTPAPSQTPFALGQRGSDATNRFTGRVYGLIVLGRAATTAERGLIEAWLGERCG